MGDMIEKEWRAWKDVCDALLQVGAITDADMYASQFSRETPGADLLFLIRTWGETLAALQELGDF